MTEHANVTNNELQRNTPLRVVAKIISYVFHPIIIPIYLGYTIYKLSPLSFAHVTPLQIKQWPASIIINVVFFPLLSVLLLKGLGFIKSIQMRDPKERIIPLIMIMIFYFWAYLVAKGNSYPLLLKTLFLANFWGIILVFLVNIFFKVSMHTAAMGGVVGMMILLTITSPVNLMVLLIIAIAVAGIVGAARMILKEHSKGELLIGYIIGILVQLAAYAYLR